MRPYQLIQQAARAGALANAIASEIEESGNANHRRLVAAIRDIVTVVLANRQWTIETKRRSRRAFRTERALKGERDERTDDVSGT